MVVIAFKTLSEHEFNSISNSFNPVISGQGQGDINIFRRYRPNKLTRGQGLLSILSQIGKRALPFLKEFVLPSAKDYGKKVLSDVVYGKPLKSSLKSRGKESLKDIGRKIGKKIMRGGASRKRNTSALTSKKKKALKSLRRRPRKARRRPKKRNKKKNKKNKLKTKKGNGVLKKSRSNKSVTKKNKIKRFARSQRTLAMGPGCSRRKTPSCPKDIFS